MYDQGKISATNCLLIDDLLLLHGNQNKILLKLLKLIILKFRIVIIPKEFFCEIEIENIILITSII